MSEGVSCVRVCVCSVCGLYHSGSECREGRNECVGEGECVVCE